MKDELNHSSNRSSVNTHKLMWQRPHSANLVQIILFQEIRRGETTRPTGWVFVQQTKIIIKMQPKKIRLEISDNAINVNGGSEVNNVIPHLNTK